MFRSFLRFFGPRQFGLLAAFTLLKVPSLLATS
jgi:hypothetical protein